MKKIRIRMEKRRKTKIMVRLASSLSFLFLSRELRIRKIR